MDPWTCPVWPSRSPCAMPLRHLLRASRATTSPGAGRRDTKDYTWQVSESTKYGAQNAV